MDSESPLDLSNKPQKVDNFSHGASFSSTNDDCIKHFKIHRKTKRASQIRAIHPKLQKKHLSSSSDTVINRIPSPELKNESKSKSDQEHYILDENLAKQSNANERLSSNPSSSPEVISFFPKIVNPYFPPTVGFSIPVGGDGTTSSNILQMPGAIIKHYSNPPFHYPRPQLPHNFTPSLYHIPHSRTVSDFCNPPGSFLGRPALVSPAVLPLQRPRLQPFPCIPASSFNESKSSSAKIETVSTENYLPSWNEIGRSPSLIARSDVRDSSTESMSTKCNSLKRSSTGSSISLPSTNQYQCVDCSKRCATLKRLDRHRQLYCVAQTKKKIKCQYCEKVCTSLGDLKMHIGTHTLPCKCNFCGKTFSKPSTLQRHIRQHTGEKPFICNLCSRAFSQQFNLTAHQQTHLYIKKYSCTSCSKKFLHRPSLISHIEKGVCISV